MASGWLLIAAIFVATTFGAWLLITGTSKAAEQYRVRFTDNAQETLSRMFVFVDGARLFQWNIVAIVVVPLLVYLVSTNIVFAAVSALAVLAVPSVLYRRLARKRLETIELGLPDALAQLAGAMRAGSTFSIAMENMVRETRGPISQEFGMVLKEQRLGVSLDDALENLARRVNSENIELIVAASLVAKDVGGNLAETFQRLSSMLREKIAMEGKIRALTAQGKLQGWVVGMLPVGMILVLSQMEAHAISALVSTVGGWIWLATIVVLELMGLWMIRKIVAIDV